MRSSQRRAALWFAIHPSAPGWLSFGVRSLRTMPPLSHIGLFQKVRVCAALVAAVLFVGCKPVYKTRTPRFAEDVKKVVEASELQQWATTVLQETAQTNLTEIPKDRVPSAIRTLISDDSP